jgi:outer membrane protein assembly complex protein YaeT
VDIQPQLLAREDDPGARFTFGKLLTPQLKLVYSIGLNDAEARFFLAQYRFRLGREITAKVQREDGGVYSYGAGQRWRWGVDRSGFGGRRRATDDTVKLTEVRLEGVPTELAGAARARVRVAVGDQVTFWRLQDESDRVLALLRSAGYLEALVSADLEGTEAVLDVRPGARYAWMVDGTTTPPDLTPEIQRAFFEEEAIEHGRARLLEAMHSRGFVKARVDTDVRGDASARTIVFHVQPGQPAVVREVSFPGATELSPGALLDAAGGQAALVNEPSAARERILTAYRDRHFLAAQVGLPSVREAEDRSFITIEVPIEEGPRAQLAEVRFEGITQDETALGDAAAIETGTPYDPFPVEDAVQRIRAYYLERGYASVRVQPRLEPRDTDVDLVLRIQEGRQQFVGDVVFEGLRRTKEATVRRVVPFEKGDPLDPRELVMLERRLLDLDVFRRATASASEDEQATIKVRVREDGPYSLQYDVRHSQEDGFSAVLDGEVGNIAGTALALGARYRAGTDIRDVRGSLHLPALGKSAEITAAVFREEQDFLLLRENGNLLPFVTLPDTERQQGFEIQQSFSAYKRWDVLYGYRFKKIESLQQEFEQTISGVQLAALRETRDNPLDAREGSFLSLSTELGPEFMGSDFNFFRVLGQFFIARPVGSTLTWAQGFRLGFANGLDEQLRRQAELFGRSTEAFRAGGAHSMRGYAADSVGPEGPIPGLSRGGESLVILNQEIRYRHPLGLGVAAFYDVGNVYDEIKDLTSLKLRHSIGAGLRYESPIGLLRLDIGIPLNKRSTDRTYQWFFSLGQAF